MNNVDYNRGSVPSLSERFEELARFCFLEEELELGELIDRLKIYSHGLLSFFFALPFLLPIPLPGFSVVVGLLLAVEGMAIAMNKKVMLPQSWLRFKLKKAVFVKLFGHSSKWIKKLEKIIRPRWAALFNKNAVRISVGLMIAVCGLLLAAPLPPGTNFPPAIAIIFLSLSLLERDVIFLAIGSALFALNCAGFAYLIVFGERLFRNFF